ncbi:hypothetical protein QA802_34300 [Streptomyces sp. B21-105]|uniref:hypothetical protein n=1 Tax=Streptomyces sp. B21-105 TaxID=3039417 RepID=UPI002FEEC38D
MKRRSCGHVGQRRALHDPAKAVLRDRTLTGWHALARADDLCVITSAATLGRSFGRLQIHFDLGAAKKA